MISQPTNPGSLPKLDWRAYFRAFCEAHGGDPVAHGGRLLFQDGWQYSSTDHAGPEWPPPEDPNKLLALRRFYWQRRRQIVEAEWRKLWEAVRGLEELQGHKSAPLQSQAGREGGERRAAGPLDLAGLKARLSWLQDDVGWCEQKLAELAGAQPQVEGAA